MLKRKTAQAVDHWIMKTIRARKHPTTFSTQDFAHLGKPAAVRKALERLVRRGELRRVRRGYYDRPRPHPLLGQTAPDPMELVRGIMENSGAQWQVSGAYAANLLGLSEQVPSKIVILTNGVPRKVPLGRLTLDFRRAAPRHLLGAGKPVGLVIQAIRHLRATGMTPEIIARLRQQLDPATKSDLVALAPKLAAWMRPIAHQIAATT